MTISGSSSGQQDRYRLSSTRLLMMEGFGDQALCKRFATGLGLSDLHLHVVQTNTGAAFRKELAVLLLDDYFQANGTSIGLISDADSDPASTLAKLQQALERNSLPVPLSEESWTTVGRWRTGIFVMPGTGKSGMLEDLLLAASDPARIEIAKSYLTALEDAGMPPFKNATKSLFQAYLSGLPKVTQTATAYIRDGSLSPQHEAASAFASFLRTM